MILLGLGKKLRVDRDENQLAAYVYLKHLELQDWGKKLLMHAYHNCAKHDRLHYDKELRYLPQKKRMDAEPDLFDWQQRIDELF